MQTGTATNIYLSGNNDFKEPFLEWLFLCIFDKNNYFNEKNNSFFDCIICYNPK